MTIYPKLNKQEVICLKKSIENEYRRWVDIMNQIQDEDSPIIADYDNDSIRLDRVWGMLNDCLEDNMTTENLSFHGNDINYVIEAVDNEFDYWKEGKSPLSSEEFNILEKMRLNLRELAVDKYGPEILKAAHRQRGMD